MVTKSRVELILAALSIEARRVGRQWIALCPNPDHDDKHPSWRIRDEPGSERDAYHACWACGFQGGPVGLVMLLKDVSARVAKQFLIDIEAGVAKVHEPPPALVETYVRTKGFRLPVGVHEGIPFEKWPSQARRYLEARHLTRAQIIRWGIAFADEGRLEHRVVLISRTTKGKPLNYTARTYVDHEKRYYEPEAHERADRNAMFGEEHWLSYQHSYRYECRTVIVIEGAFNGLAVERALPDVPFAATAGTAIMPGYAIKLTQFDHAILATDPDAAGDKLASELSYILRRQRMKVTRARLPDGIDADAAPPEQLREVLERAMR